MTFLDESYKLTDEQIGQYKRNGHILLPQVAPTAEMPPYRDAMLRTAEALSGPVAPLAERDTYGKAFRQIWHLCEHDETVAKFVLGRRFAKVAADLMGVDRVRLYHDQVLYKEPGGGPTPWHQDQYYIPLDTNNVMTMWIALVDCSEEMGTMRHASGSHADGPLLPIGISDQSQTDYEHLIGERGWPIAHCGDMQPGDLSAHTGWTVHCAPGNHTDRMREAITIIYYEDGARILPGNEYGNKVHMGDFKVGDLAASWMNPIVFDRRG